MLNQRTRIGLWSVTLLTALVGVVNLLSAVTPSLPNRVEWLQELYPFEVRAGAHLFAALTGFGLLTLATHLLRRKRVAWWLAMILLGISILSHLVKGLDFEESLLSTVLLGQLWWMRRVFTARSDRPSILQGVRVLLGALLFTLIYGTLGFFLLDRHYAVQFSLKAALAQTLAMFLTEDNAGLQPTTRFGSYFANSIYLIGASTLTYGLGMLLRPVIFQNTATEAERLRAKKIIERYGHSSLARFALLPDKSYYFSPSGNTVIAYVPKGRGAIALGDPIGPEDDFLKAVQGFQNFCDRNDWHPAFYQTLPEHLEQYHTLGFRSLKIGEEAVVDLQQFTLEGKAGRNLRTAVNKFTKQGYRVEFYPPPLSQVLLQELQVISDEWLAQMHGAEKKFSLGWFDLDYLQNCEVAVVLDPQGIPIAFANIVPEYQLNEATIDLMRHRQNAERGAMDFLFVSLLQHFKSRGYDGFNLGLVALAGVGETPEASKLERGVHYLYTHLNQIYNFQGLRAYKDKFQPRWEARYLLYPRLTDLPDTVVALVRADSNDRLQDYFGAQFLSTTLTQSLKQLSRFAPLLLSGGLFALSIWAISAELRQYHPQTLLSSITAIPARVLLIAVGLTTLNYLFLTGYDTLATRFVRHPLPYLKTALVAVVSYAISNSVGFALLSGSAIRYRFYATWGLTPGKIAQIIAFCNLSFWLGLFAVGGALFLIEPLTLPDLIQLPFNSVHPLGIIFLAIVIAYLGWNAFAQRSLRLGNFVLPHLPISLSLAQIVVTSCDWALAAGVLYALLPTPIPISFPVFFGIYLLSQITGIISNVPGGLGVFETVMLWFLTPPFSSAALLGALVAYRAIYYFLPLLIGAGILGGYELRSRFKALNR